MFWKIRHVLAALVFLTSMAGATSNSGGVARASEAMAEILAASFLADQCRVYVKRLGGRSHHRLIEDGVIIQINESNVTMSDFVQLTKLYSAEAMLRYRNRTLRRFGVDPSDRQGMCFLARSLSGASRGPGRFLERR